MDDWNIVFHLEYHRINLDIIYAGCECCFHLFQFLPWQKPTPFLYRVFLPLFFRYCCSTNSSKQTAGIVGGCL